MEVHSTPLPLGRARVKLVPYIWGPTASDCYTDILRFWFCSFSTNSATSKNLYFSFILQLKRELEAFDPDFFEELEDLKYNYKKSVERNVLYERQLKQLSRQFGVSVNIPDDDDY